MLIERLVLLIDSNNLLYIVVPITIPCSCYGLVYFQLTYSMYSYICIPRDRTADRSKMLVCSGSRNVAKRVIHYMQPCENKCEPLYASVLF